MMTLSIEQLVPIPLKEKLKAQTSDVWLKNFKASSPEYISIQAPSGTGKTTLVHFLYGLRTDFEGNIFWDKKDLSQFSAEEKAVLRATEVSVIFQDMRLFPELSAWENLELKRSITNTVSAEEASEWMQQLGIGDKKNALAQTLSYGEQQRLAIIRSLLQPFSFLLMDEPFSHLDHKNTAIAASLIAQIVQRNNAGLLLADLDENDYFPYHKTYML
jgi:ABC-type lipoprotein export system ATPase subunit